MNRDITARLPFWRKRLPFVITAAALIYSIFLLFRMLWFDEVLTANLLMKLPFSRIYFAYEIPNNHIVFTLLEKIWYEGLRQITPFFYFCFRILPLLFSIAAIYFLCRKLIRTSGLIAGTALPLFFVLSAVWAMYATAIRGYMLGFFLTVLAMLSAEYLLKYGKWNYLWYFLLALLSLGTAPTNLAALYAVSLYYLPFAWHNRCKSRWFFTIFSPLAALLLFYLPILPKFIGCMKLGEGWWSRSNAIFVLYSGALFPIAGLLIFCLAGTVLLWWKYPKLRLQILCGIGILLLPLPAFLLFKMPPFPRVFFPLTVVWLFLLSHALNAWNKQYRKSRLLILPLLLQGLLTLVFFQERAEIAANQFYGTDGRGDDYIAPYYARKNFEPHQLLRYLKTKWDNGERFHVFATFDSDAPSLLFAQNLQDFPDNVLLADTLNRPRTLRFQDYPGVKYIIAENEKDLQNILQRFGLHRAVKEKESGIQILYKVID